MADATYSSQKTYRQLGGDRIVIASGGSLDVESGGEIDIESGGNVTVASGGALTVESGGTLTVASGAALAVIPNAITDPGDAGAIPVTESGICNITTAAAETRTLAIPTFDGQEIQLNCTVYAVGDAVVTVASAVNQTGNNTLTLGVAGDWMVLRAHDVGGTLAWRVLANDGVALSTV